MLQMLCTLVTLSMLHIFYLLDTPSTLLAVETLNRLHALRDMFKLLDVLALYAWDIPYADILLSVLCVGVSMVALHIVFFLSLPLLVDRTIDTKTPPLPTSTSPYKPRPCLDLECYRDRNIATSNTTTYCPYASRRWHRRDTTRHHFLPVLP